MGLDGVEIVMETERAFGIEIPDRDAERTKTPRQFIDYVADRVHALPDEQCVTQRTFYQLRRGFRAALGDPDLNVTLDTELSEFSDKAAWPALWSKMRGSQDDRRWPEVVPWRGFFGGGPKDVRALVWLVAAEVLRTPGTSSHRWTRAEVEATIREIVMMESGVELAFDARKRFSELGID